MTKEQIKKQKLMFFLSAAILVVGLGSAGWIYWSSQHEGGSESGYEIVGDFVYPNSMEKSKKYVHDLQLYGGKAAVLADNFMRWWYGLWYGKALAKTIAFLALVFSLAVFLTARVRFARNTCIDEPDNQPCKGSKNDPI